MTTTSPLSNYIDGSWCAADGSESLRVVNPATAEVLALVPLSSAIDVARAADAAAAAFDEWRRVPPGERVQHLFRLKQLLEDELDDLARTVTIENGKTLAEARGEIRRAIENIEVACGIPTLLQGDVSEDIAPGIDELMIRQPLGVCATICPFNFPAMIPFWFLPYALACGNTYIIKPSERTPLTMEKIVRLIEGAGFPPGVVNMVHGGEHTAAAILEHPAIGGITFVGSTRVARHIYREASAHGKRVQAQGGAKNPVVILPDADLETTRTIVADSAFGSAGQRCLAASLAISVGEASAPFREAISEVAESRVVGYGLDPGVEMGPVISQESKARIESLIQRGLDEGAGALVDGRGASVPGFEGGSFLRPTVLDHVPCGSEIARTEIFGPVLGLMQADTLDDAIALVNDNSYGNMACLFTSSGAAARKFRYEAAAGNIGINIGVAAPMAYFPFSGWKDSFFGALHGQGRHAVEFFTQTKVVIERWPKVWSRRF